METQEQTKRINIKRFVKKCICSVHNDVELDFIFYYKTGILEVRPCYKCTWVNEPTEHRMGM